MAKEVKAKLSPEQERFEKMRKLADLINASQWGGENKDIASVLGDEKVISNVTRFSTGNKAIDYAFGGGVPRGKLLELWGGESAGKSTLVYHIIANYQKTYPSEGILLLDTEQSYDPLYAESLGVNARGIIHVEAQGGIGALNIAKMSAENGGVNLIIIDSIAALTTKSDDEGEIGQQTMAEQARMISQAFRVLNSLAARHDITMVVTNQVRDNIGVMYGDKSSTPAGKALKHYAHIRAKMTRTKQIKQGSGDKECVVGVEGRLDCVKNKVAPPFRKAEYTITFGVGIDNVIGAVDLGIDKGVIVKKGGWFLFDGKQYQGKTNLVDIFRSDKVLFDKLEEDLKNKMSAIAVGASEMTEEEKAEATAGDTESDAEGSVELI